jgi:RNA polymerase subunit RPABC4/transcription elongation factor Spt4
VSTEEQACPYCGAGNFVAECVQDGRLFVLTTAHLSDRRRAYDDGPIERIPTGFSLSICDFCAAKAAGLGPVEVVEAGMRQSTCPVCHTEFLSTNDERSHPTA